ncbi:MAG: C1 family peptidase [Thermoleophilaceae bacterium]
MRHRIPLLLLTASLIMLIGAGHAAAAPPQARHALGLLPTHTSAPRHFAASKQALAALPDSVDLTQWAMAPGNQGPVGSCVAWAVGYTAMGYWENRDHIETPGGGSAMYIYSQTHWGNDQGSTFPDDFGVAVNQGVDNRDDYTQGDFDWIDPPTPLEIAHAANWKLSGYTELPRTQADIEKALANGRPVSIGIPVTAAFETNNSRTYPDPNDPTDNTTVLGGHGVTALAYDQVGLTIENSWGPYWDNHGYVKIRWSWLADNLGEAWDVGDLIHDTPPNPPAPPVNDDPPTIGGSANVGNSLSESHGDWTNSPTTYTYQWQRGDAAGANFADIAGETGRTYKVSAADVGHTIRVEEWAGNAAGTGGPTASEATVVVPVPPTPPPSPPVNTAAPTIRGRVEAQSMLSEVHGDWSNAPASYSCQWQRGDGSGANFVDITGATGQNYEIATGDGGHTIRVEEWAKNDGGTGGPAASSATSVVPAPNPPTPPPPPPTQPPLAVVAPTVSGLAQQGQVLNVSTGVWMGSPHFYTYRWQEDGSVDIPGATDSSYTAQSADVGHRLNVVVTAINSGGFTSVVSDSTQMVSGPRVGPQIAPAKPSIGVRPHRRTGSRSAAFSFTDRSGGVTFQVKLDRGRWTTAASRVVYRGLGYGRHTLSARAVLNGQASNAVRFTWRIVRRAR